MLVMGYCRANQAWARPPNRLDSPKRASSDTLAWRRTAAKQHVDHRCGIGSLVGVEDDRFCRAAHAGVRLVLGAKLGWTTVVDRGLKGDFDSLCLLSFETGLHLFQSDGGDLAQN